MSIKLMSAIWTHSELSSSSTIKTKAGEEMDNPNTVRTMKMVLLALADMANDEGICWPSYRLLAEKVNITENYLRRGIIPRCEANGWLERKDRYDGTGRQTSNYYVLNVEKILTPPTHTEQPSPHRPRGEGGTQTPGGGGHTEHPHDPSLEPSLEPPEKKQASPPAENADLPEAYDWFTDVFLYAPFSFHGKPGHREKVLQQLEEIGRRYKKEQVVKVFELVRDREAAMIFEGNGKIGDKLSYAIKILQEEVTPRPKRVKVAVTLTDPFTGKTEESIEEMSLDQANKQKLTILEYVT